ncbi:hypothetical protein CARUB_v10006599mg [Capsella rubella]|uniref:F-box domain-containing protein n=1 Tax=Capsella rubella TaxID=81985 RepID=R0F911_9BRAS|nr:putative F-box protein At1g67390 [Capsella rubella]EOA18136.1 hypothetical protein CARUB_v10006599mg [Capsella rubella]
MEKSLLSSDARGKGVLVDEVVKTDDDRISILPTDLLLKILSSLTIEEAVRTSALSKRWMNVWKETADLCVDMRYITLSKNIFIDVSPYAARWMTKVINDHNGRFERVTINHYPYQCEDGTVEAWIHSLIHVKHVKHLNLVNYIIRFIAKTKTNYTLDLPPQSFSHPNLESFYLGRYNLKDPHAFRSCSNLKSLKLVGVFAEIEVFNAVLLSCPSLQVLVVKINCYEQSGPLIIGNRNLKFLYLSGYQIDGFEVVAPSLEILTVQSLSCEMDKFVMTNPRLQFSRNYWATGQLYSHTSYCISCPPQDKSSIGHEVMISASSEYMQRSASMSVSLDLTNAKEVDMLNEVLSVWPVEMEELEIVFKNNNAPMEELESCIGSTKRNFWEETKPFPSRYFRAYTVWLINFSGSKEEFALASCLIAQGTVVKKMLIRPSSIPLSNKFEIEEAVTRLNELPKCYTKLSITTF